MSLRFVSLPVIQEDIRIASLANENKESTQLFHILARAPSHPSHPLMGYIFQMRLVGLNEYYDNALKGRVVIDQSELPAFLLDMIRSAKTSIQASSYAQPASWWGQLGKGV